MVHWVELCFGLALIVGSSAAAPRMPALVPGRVYGVVGRMGTGKTLLVTSWAMNYAMVTHRRIVANFGLSCADQVVHSWAEAYELRDCLFILDEAHLWASSNSQKALTLQGRQFISQLRKRGVCLVWVSQHENRVAKALRELTTDIVQCTKYFGFHVVVFRDPDDPKANLGWSLARVDPIVASLYRTREDVPIPTDSTY